jgi:hypothetical protein
MLALVAAANGSIIEHQSCNDECLCPKARRLAGAIDPDLLIRMIDCASIESLNKQITIPAELFSQK